MTFPFARNWSTRTRSLGRVERQAKKMMERKDVNGFLEVLPIGDIVGSHGKTYLLVAFDGLRGYRTWDILEALPFDAARTDTLQWMSEKGKAVGVYPSEFTGDRRGEY
jgi:hypothetical protein